MLPQLLKVTNAWDGKITYINPQHIRLITSANEGSTSYKISPKTEIYYGPNDDHCILIAEPIDKILAMFPPV